MFKYIKRKDRLYDDEAIERELRGRNNEGEKIKERAWGQRERVLKRAWKGLVWSKRFGEFTQDNLKRFQNQDWRDETREIKIRR